jgi:hypothetical protein
MPETRTCGGFDTIQCRSMPGSGDRAVKEHAAVLFESRVRTTNPTKKLP